MMVEWYSFSEKGELLKEWKERKTNGEKYLGAKWKARKAVYQGYVKELKQISEADVSAEGYCKVLKRQRPWTGSMVVEW